MPSGLMIELSGQGYKRTNFDEDELTSNGGTPPATDYNASVVFKGGWLSWHRRNTQEKVLIVVLVLMTVALIVLASLLAVKDAAIRRLDQHKGKDVCLTPECVTIASSLLTTMDRSINPCDDFYEYACGGWIKTHPIPSGHARWGTFGTMWQENQLIMKNAIEEPVSSFASEAEQKAKLYYTSCMDPNKTVEKLGAQPLLDLMTQFKVNLSHFDSPDDGWIFQDMLEKVQLYDISAFFSLWIGEDDKNSSRNIIQIDQDGLGLPERDYYINKTIEEDKVLSAYLNYMVTINNLLAPGRHPNLTEHLTEVIKFESKLAEITTSAEDRRDEEKIYHNMTVADLNQLYPMIDWLHFINRLLATANITIDSSEEVVIYAPEYLEKLSQILNSTLSTLEGRRAVNLYLEWHVVKSMVSYLSKPFRNAKKEFSEVLSGASGKEDEWRYCISDTDSVLGFALGALFVKNAFHGDSKEKAEEMIEEIKDAFKNNLPHLEWMDSSTRQAAIDKANAVVDMIGFPKYILNASRLDEEYSELLINESEYFLNNVRNLHFVLKKNMEKLNQAPKQNVWGMTPPTVNAYYTPAKNEIVFPAGILQAPFYDKNFPKSLNFGAMGVVMGHELTHGFDDQGREFDKNGNLRPWWNDASVKRFQERTQCMADQYSQYTLGGENIRGKQTLGENIADNGGLKCAFHAYEDWLSKNGEEQMLPAVNLTHRQIFFLGFAQVWCSSSTKEANHLQIVKDPHSPAKFRVIGTLSNSKDFAEHWNCAAGSSMNPVKKCEVW
ncbi:endothelin-converting enzyme homolog isoform X1 [Pomacea canaliculata]|uniref:endothelin-converting enzyme homolog isoform X1 n=1 Tax=Pomacea canaliculata TaxID=400727 RepID=UPI000D73CC24|nr:endothelin-converting enzyme homolog isoform X1 [Pomacea canaliculata]XP_025083322.1 endothelin-converting enzyme homolog isoform X1 [Pomacea canaliculata]